MLFRSAPDAESKVLPSCPHAGFEVIPCLLAFGLQLLELLVAGLDEQELVVRAPAGQRRLPAVEDPPDFGESEQVPIELTRPLDAEDGRRGLPPQFGGSWDSWVLCMTWDRFS